MRVIGSLMAAGAFVYAGVLMVTCMAESVRVILNPQERDMKEQQEKRYRVVKVKVKQKTQK